MARAVEEHVKGILERGVVAAAELVMVGGILAAAGGEVGVGNEPGPEAALVGREGGVGDVPGEGAGRTSGEVAPEDVLCGAWQRAAGEVTGAVLDQLGVVELLLVLVIVPAFPVAGLRVVGDDASRPLEATIERPP